MTGLADALDVWEKALRAEAAAELAFYVELERGERERERLARKVRDARRRTREARAAVLDFVPPHPKGVPVVDEATGQVTRLGGGA